MEKNIVQMASKEKITRMESKIKLLEGEVEKLTDYC
jgi:TolA-binding protein